MSEPTRATDCLALATEIVEAYLVNNVTTADTLPGLIVSVYRTLATAGPEAGTVNGTAGKPKPAVPVNRSVFPDYIVCLEDGKELKMLKRHLQTAYGMTPDAYRNKWGLPASYPMTAPNYASRRSALAKQLGLGRKKVVEATEPTVTKIPPRRARGSRG